MSALEDRGMQALAPSSSGASSFDLYANIVERALVLGGMAAIGSEAALRHAGVGVTGRVMGVSLATLLTTRLAYVASRKPGDKTGGLDRVNVSMSLGEVVLLPAVGGLTLILSRDHKREGAALLGMSAIGAAITAVVLSGQSAPGTAKPA